MHSGRRRRWRCWRAAPALLAANPADDAPLVTQHGVRIDGQELAYIAEVGRVAIRDVETGQPHGYMFYTAYRAASRKGYARRPVMFVWDGGPGAPSAWLHFDIAGPKLLQGTQLVDNSDTWLAATDLVLVDPIGTGFSRPTSTAYEHEFYGTVGDVASVTEFVRCWLILHDAVGAPVFLAGESWGAGRAASVAYALEKRGINVNGIILISGGFGLDKRYGSPSLLQGLGVVDMASTALYWHRSAPDLGKDPAAVRRAAEAWVRATYAPALAHLGELSTAERNRIAEQLARFTGIAPAAIDRRTLVVTPHQFRTELLKSEGKVLYLLDGRRTSPPSDAGTPQMLQLPARDSGLSHRSALPRPRGPDSGLRSVGHLPAECRRAVELCHRAHDCRAGEGRDRGGGRLGRRAAAARAAVARHAAGARAQPTSEGAGGGGNL